MATGSYLTPNHSRSQSEIQGDLHKVGAKIENLLKGHPKPRSRTVSMTSPKAEVCECVEANYFEGYTVTEN
ncbi:hypothetical protein TNCV_1931721 [Trichonephila clavipes]|nr:hypothetical protein TNCV_1931721 [Trichonephila clavipes]